MNHPQVLLSARLAHLEALALPLPELQRALDVLNVQRDQLLGKIAAARHAAAQLDLIGQHILTVLADQQPGEASVANSELNSEFIPDLQPPATAPVDAAAEQEAAPSADLEVPTAPTVLAVNPESNSEGGAPGAQGAGQSAKPGESAPQDSGPGTKGVPGPEGLRAWVRTLDGHPFAAEDAAEELQLPLGSVVIYCRRLRDEGVLAWQPADWGTGRPAQYRMLSAQTETADGPGQGQQEEAPEQEPAQDIDPARLKADERAARPPRADRRDEAPPGATSPHLGAVPLSAGRAKVVRAGPDRVAGRVPDGARGGGGVVMAPPAPLRRFIVRRNGQLLVRTVCRSAGELHDVLAAHGATVFEWATALWQGTALFHVTHAGLSVTEAEGPA